MFLWGVVLVWWLLTGIAATIFGGTTGLLVYLVGIWGYLVATDYRFVSPELAGLIFVTGGFIGLLGEMLGRKITERYPVKNQVTSILVGASTIAVLIGILIGPFSSMLIHGSVFGLPFLALVKKHPFRQWVMSYFPSLFRISFVLIVNLILMHCFIKGF